MKNIDIMLAEDYSSQMVVPGSVLDECLQKHNAKVNEFKKSLSEDQLKSYNELETVSNQLDVEVQLDVVRFMLKVISSMFNYQ